MEPARDDVTGDYVLDEAGRLVMTDTPEPAIRTRLRGRRRRWLHAPNQQWGSDFYAYKRRPSTKFSDGLAESIATRALEPLENNGRIADVAITTEQTKRGGVAITVFYKDTLQGENYAVTTPVGG